MKHLFTKAEYDELNPHAQGFIQYMQGELPGSELKGLENPYIEGSWQHRVWNEGQQAGCLAAQDSEE